MGHASASGVVGWVLPTKGKVAPPAAFRITRADPSAQVAGSELAPCDKVQIVDEREKLYVALIDGARLPLDSRHPFISVPCEVITVSDIFATAFRLLFKPPPLIGDGEVPAVTRGVGGLTVPAFAASAAALGSGGRRLFLAWDDGRAPFKVSLKRQGSDQAIVAARDIASNHILLPSADLAPDRYQLTVSGATGDGITQRELVVVTADRVPRLPRASVPASLSNTEKALLWAEFLENEDDGRWTLEALQIVGSLPREDPLVAAWLRRFGVD